MRKISINSSGFTLIELLIATTVFAVILLAASSTLIQVSRMYYKGIISSKTQGAARTAIDEFSRALQFTSGDYTKVDYDLTKHQGVYCVGDKRFTYKLNTEIDGSASEDNPPTHKSRHALWQDKLPAAGATACDNDLDLTNSNPYGDPQDLEARQGKELLEENMRVSVFDVTPVGAGDQIYNVKLRVTYGDDELLTDPESSTTNCKGSMVGGQWCSFSELSTQIYRRIVK